MKIHLLILALVAILRSQARVVRFQADGEVESEFVEDDPIDNRPIGEDPERCTPIGETCNADNYNGECCKTEEITTCVEPYLRLGFDRCQICASDGASCNSRTECCSNCCSDGLCAEEYESCNLIETFWITTFWFLIFVGVCIGLYFLIKWICDSINSSKMITRRRVLKQGKTQDQGTTLIVMGKDRED